MLRILIFITLSLITSYAIGQLNPSRAFYLDKDEKYYLTYSRKLTVRDTKENTLFYKGKDLCYSLTCITYKSAIQLRKKNKNFNTIDAESRWKNVKPNKREPTLPLHTSIYCNKNNLWTFNTYVPAIKEDTTEGTLIKKYFKVINDNTQKYALNGYYQYYDIPFGTYFNISNDSIIEYDYEKKSFTSGKIIWISNDTYYLTKDIEKFEDKSITYRDTFRIKILEEKGDTFTYMFSGENRKSVSCFIKKYSNLIKNGSFEEITECPSQMLFSKYDTSYYTLKNWTSANKFPLLLKSTCNKKLEFNAENNFLSSNTTVFGNNYIGLIYFSELGLINSYIQTKLATPLKKGKTYCFGFKYMLANKSKYKSKNLYFAFTDTMTVLEPRYLSDINIYEGPITLPNYNKINTIDSKLWETANYTYTANGSEKYLMLGNFNYLDKSIILPTLSKGRAMVSSAIYFFDEIYLIEKIDTTTNCSCINGLQIND